MTADGFLPQLSRQRPGCADSGGDGTAGRESAGDPEGALSFALGGEDSSGDSLPAEEIGGEEDEKPPARGGSRRDQLLPFRLRDALAGEELATSGETEAEESLAVDAAVDLSLPV